MSTKSTRSSGTQHNLRGVAQGTTLVGQGSGLPIDEVVDANGVRRLAVDTSVSLDVDHVNLSVDVNALDGDSVAILDPDTGFALQIEANGSINANMDLDASTGDTVAISGHTNPLFREQADSLTTSGFEQIFSHVVISNSKLIFIESTASTNCVFRVKINGTVIKQLRSSPTKPNVEFNFREHRPINLGDTVVVEAKASRFFTNNSPYDTFTSLEGYEV